MTESPVTRLPLLSIRSVRYLIGDPPSACELVVPRLDIQGGARMAVVGPSGSGKSTLLELMSLARRPSAGEFVWCESDGTDCMQLSDLWRSNPWRLRRMRASSISYAPQRGGYVSSLTVADNIRLRCDLSGCGVPTKKRMTEIISILDMTPDKLGRRPDSLSAGERQRCVLAQSLFLTPHLMIADEPTSALHPTQALTVLKALALHARDCGAALVIATHDESLARQLGFTVVTGRTARNESGHVTIFGPSC